jgi:hypothetical protein
MYRLHKNPTKPVTIRLWSSLTDARLTADDGPIPGIETVKSSGAMHGRRPAHVRTREATRLAASA